MTMTITHEHDDRRDGAPGRPPAGARRSSTERARSRRAAECRSTCSTSCAPPAASGSCAPRRTAGSRPTCRRDAGARVARPGRRVGRLDRDDRCRVLDRPRPPSPGDLRRALRHQPRRHHRRRVQPDRLDHPGRRRLPGHRSLELRQRVRARRRGSSATAWRASSTACRSCAAPCSPQTTSRSRTPGRCPGSAARAATTSTSTAPSSPPSAPTSRWDGEPCIDALIVHLPAAGRLLAGDGQRRARHRARARSTTSPCWRRTRCRCSSPAALGGNPLFQLDLATADTDLRAAREPPLRRGRAGLGDRGRGRPADDGAASARTGLRRVGRRPGAPRSSPPPTGPAAEARCTRTARSSVASATSTPSASTSSSAATPWSPRARSSPARTSSSWCSDSISRAAHRLSFGGR